MKAHPGLPWGVPAQVTAQGTLWCFSRGCDALLASSASGRLGRAGEGILAVIGKGEGLQDENGQI